METIHEKTVYTAVTQTTGGRSGKSRSSDGELDIILSPPGSKRKGTNPEQLFAAGWSACFIGAMEIAARKLKVVLPPDHYVSTEVDLVLTSDGYVLEARLNISLPGLDPEVSQRIIAAAELSCPYSKATKGNVKTTYTLV